MFSGNAEEAMNFYTSLFDQSEIIEINRYGANEIGIEGTVLKGTFLLKGQLFRCTDSSVKHDFSFTPAMSFWVTCDTEEEINQVFENLSQAGKVLMPLDAYSFSQKFGWVEDKYGVSWQLNLS